MPTATPSPVREYPLEDAYYWDWGESIDIWLPIGSPRLSGAYCNYTGRLPRMLEFDHDQCRVHGKVIDPGKSSFTYEWIDLDGNQKEALIVFITASSGEPWIAPPATATPTPNPRQLHDDNGTSNVITIEATPTPTPQGTPPTVSPTVIPPTPTPSIQTFTIGFACTGSMEPFITCLDTATIQTSVAPEDLHVGAVIAFDCDGALYVHRITAISGNRYTTKGDASARPDDCVVTFDDISGLLLSVQRGANHTPEKEAFRDIFLESKRKLDEAWGASEEAWSAYETYGNANCSYSEAEEVYYCTGAAFDEASSLHDRYSYRFCQYSSAYEVWKYYALAAISQEYDVPPPLEVVCNPPTGG